MPDETQPVVTREDFEAMEVAQDLGLESVDEEVSGGLDRPRYKEENYPAWSKETSRVISGPLGDAKFKGTRFDRWQSAEHYARGKYPVIAFWTQGSRWYARIKYGQDSI